MHKLVPLIALGSILLLLSGCSKNNLRTGTDYKNVMAPASPSASDFSSTIYVFFSDNVVSVYRVINAGSIVVRLQRDGSLHASSQSYDMQIGGRPKGTILMKGTDETTRMEVLFGPGDWMPVLEYAPYKVEGSSVYVDWSQNHSLYFSVTASTSGSEVFTIKNEGLVLESSTTPGFTLTLDTNGKHHAISSGQERYNLNLQEQSRIFDERQRQLRGQ